MQVLTEMKAWQVSSALFPGPEAHPDDILRSLVHWAVLAPSSLNVQPWWFRITDGRLELHADRTRALPITDPLDREMTIACGAALFNIRTAARHFGFEPVIREFPAGIPTHSTFSPTASGHAGSTTLPVDLIATVALGQRIKPEGEDDRLYKAIPRRRTNREPFLDKPVEDSILLAMERCARTDCAWFHLVRDLRTRHNIADLVAEADKTQFHDASFRRELASWVHPNRAHSCDGMPGQAFGLGDLTSILGPTLIRTFDMGGSAAKRDHDLAEHSPALAVIGSTTDTPGEWLHAGMALQHALLLATSAGLSASYLNAPIQVPALRPRLAKVIFEQGYPQVLLRLGYSQSQIKATPRRPADSVIRVDTPTIAKSA